MKRYNFFLLFFLFVSTSFAFINPPDSLNESLIQTFKNLPDVEEVTQLEGDSQYPHVYEIMIRQPLDHLNPNRNFFLQRIYVAHLDFDKPVVFESDGYAVNKYRINELSQIFNANEILVEHRYFGKSKPDSLTWKYLNSEQIAADLHHIVAVFKNIYKGKWIGTGRSKGGQTTLFFRYYYPDDMNATVAYVAPINLKQENKNINKFISSEAGTKECREKINNFQIAVLGKRKELLPMFRKYSAEKNYYFPIGEEKAFEFGVLEYPYSFWQEGKSSCDSIPSGKNIPAEKLFHELTKVVDFGYYTDKEIKYYYPLFYQSFTELGYYNFRYNSKKVLSLLKKVKDPSNKIFAPPDVKIKYNPDVIHNIVKWVQTKAKNIIFIEGGNDPWSMGANINLTGQTNCRMFIKKNGNHYVKILEFPDETRDKIISLIKSWIAE